MSTRRTQPFVRGASSWDLPGYVIASAAHKIRPVLRTVLYGAPLTGTFGAMLRSMTDQIKQVLLCEILQGLLEWSYDTSWKVPVSFTRQPTQEQTKRRIITQRGPLLETPSNLLRSLGGMH